MKHFKKVTKITLIVLTILISCYAGLFLYAKIKPKLVIEAINSYYIYDNNNNLYSNNNYNEWINLDDISDYLINATIATEDKRFFKHHGFDYLRIIKSLYTNAKNNTLQGASTISQQYVKNLFLEFDKTWKRKTEEAWLTIRLETSYSKEEILEGYLNTINYGGVYGIENASKYYFNKNASELNLAEASILAGIPKWPSEYSPYINEEAAKDRQYIVLNSMVENNYITKEEMNEAYNTQLTYKKSTDDDSLKMIMYYQDAVINELKNISSIPKSVIESGGLKIYTNLDLNTQKLLEESINNNIENNNELQVASVVVEPTSGKILALTGGRDYSKSQYNRAISAKRQVGSTLKPFLYYSALENGFTPSTTFTSEETTFVFGNNNTYSPSNYGDIYANKPISLAAAIAYSDNIFAVKTHLFLGEDSLHEIANRVGITNSLDVLPSTILGTQELNIMQMLNGYITLANNGIKKEPYLISKVEDFNGNILYEHKDNEEVILNSSVVYILNELLSNCSASELVDYTSPTCLKIASKLTNKYAIKTGTTESDVLIFGYNNDLLIGTWLGYDDNKKVNNLESSISKNIWADVIEGYFKEKQTNWYETPNNVVGVLVNPITGELITDINTTTNNKKILYYIKGTEPYLEEQVLDNLIPTTKYIDESSEI